MRAILHPFRKTESIGRIEADVRGGRVLELVFRVSGRIADVLVPEAAVPARMDGLWKHTCFEMFLKPGEGEGYYEFNFSPSGEWAAYKFDSYRQGMRVAEEISPPKIALRKYADGLELRVEIALESVPGPYRLGLSAVIEGTNGSISYWALAHPAEKPDFHRPDGFVLALPALT